MVRVASNALTANQMVNHLVNHLVKCVQRALSSRFFNLRLKAFKLVTDLILLSSQSYNNGPAIGMV